MAVDGDVPAGAEPTRGLSRTRLVVGLLVVPALVNASWLAWALAVRDRLPDPLASHFALDGRADAASSFGQFLVSPLRMVGIMWGTGLVLAAIARRGPQRCRIERLAVAWSNGVAVFAASTTVPALAANLDVANAFDVSLTPGVIALMGIMPLVAAVVAWLLIGSCGPTAAPAPGR